MKEAKLNQPSIERQKEPGDSGSGTLNPSGLGVQFNRLEVRPNVVSAGKVDTTRTIETPRREGKGN